VLTPYNLLENILSEIEINIKKGINTDFLASRYAISERHLRRLFKFAFKQSLMAYIRSRKLAASLSDLLNKNYTILDIAIDYDFGYEQTYIRAFKREFGITPGELRKSGKIVKIKSPINFCLENKTPEGVSFEPDIVMVPQFHIAGKSHLIPFKDPDSLMGKLALQFWENDRASLKNIINPHVYIGLSCNANYEAKNIEYIPSLQVKNFKNIPHDYRKYTFESCLCAKFRYIGKHHYYDISKYNGDAVLNEIRKYTSDKKSKYSLDMNRVYFEKLDIESYDGTYCMTEWFTPVIEKSKLVRK